MCRRQPSEQGKLYLNCSNHVQSISLACTRWLVIYVQDVGIGQYAYDIQIISSALPEVAIWPAPQKGYLSGRDTTHDSPSHQEVLMGPQAVYDLCP